MRGPHLAASSRVRWLFAAVLLSSVGCGFSAVSGGVAGDDQPAEPGDDDPAPDGPPASARRCSTDPTLRLCLDFDEDNLVTDGSSFAHDVTSANIAVMPRATEQAALLVTASRLQVGETPDLDLTSDLTTSMWMQMDPALLPTAATVGRWLLDNNSQYFMAVRDNGKLRCGGGPITLESPERLVGVDSEWHHVACTFDGALWSVYVDGNRVACRTSARPLDVTGTAGLALGANLGGDGTVSETYAGGLDNIEVFARAKSPAEICAAAGQTGCSAACPQPE